MRFKATEQRLFALPVTEDGPITISGRRTVQAHVGDLRIYDAARPNEPVDVLMPAVFAELYEPIIEGTLTLSPAQVTRCAKLVRLGGLRSAEEFVEALEALAHVRIGGVEINWTPAQLDDLTRRAQKRGWTVEKYVQYLLDKWMQEMWTI